jgi:transposase-like protein
MSRICTVCAHPERQAVDTALVAGGAYRDIAGRYGLSKSAVERHQAEHLPAALVRGEAAREEARALDVLQQLKFINGAALSVLRDARAAGEGELVLKAVDRVMKQVELQAKLLGDLDERPVVNVLVSPEWQQVRGTMLRALAPFPAARLAVAAALQAQETA